MLPRCSDSSTPSFIGLTGPVATIDAMADSVGVSIEPPVASPRPAPTRSPTARRCSRSPPDDDQAHVVYTAGAGSKDYAHDLPLLAENKV